MQFFDAIFEVASLTVGLLVEPLRLCFMLVTTKRGLSLGFLPSARTTPALYQTCTSAQPLPMSFDHPVR